MVVDVRGEGVGSRMVHGTMRPARGLGRTRAGGAQELGEIVSHRQHCCMLVHLPEVSQSSPAGFRRPWRGLRHPCRAWQGATVVTGHSEGGAGGAKRHNLGSIAGLLHTPHYWGGRAHVRVACWRLPAADGCDATVMLHG
jgi:hypothetical protein